MAQRSRNGSPSPLKCVCSSPCSPNPSTNDAVMMSQDSLDKNRNFPPSILDGADGQRHSAQLVALGELEFRKAFLLLSYLGEKRLEDAISADEIRKLKDLPMHNFELEVWNAFGQQYIKKEERKKFFDWDSGQTHLYRCYVSQNGSCRFQGPYLEKTATHMHRVLGDDNVLMVKFAEEMTNKENSALSVNDLYFKYHRFASEGIFVGLRRYRFFGALVGRSTARSRSELSSIVHPGSRVRCQICLKMAERRKRRKIQLRHQSSVILSAWSPRHLLIRIKSVFYLGRQFRKLDLFSCLSMAYQTLPNIWQGS